MNNKITKEEFDLLYDDSITKKQYNEIKNKIDIRVHEIAEKFFVNFNATSSYDYDNGEDEDDGHFDETLYKDTISFDYWGTKYPPGYPDGLPTRWLWEDFEDELVSTSNEFLDKQAKAKAKAKEAREKDKLRRAELYKSIKSKLTPEELKVIKFK